MLDFRDLEASVVWIMPLNTLFPHLPTHTLPCNPFHRSTMMIHRALFPRSLLSSSSWPRSCLSSSFSKVWQFFLEMFMCTYHRSRHDLLSSFCVESFRERIIHMGSWSRSWLYLFYESETKNAFLIILRNVCRAGWGYRTIFFFK